MKVAAALALLALCAPAGARQDDAAPARERAPGARADARERAGPRLAFRWGRAGSVPVREIETFSTAAGEVDLVSTYKVGWTTTAEGVVVTRTPRTFETLAGKPVSPDAKALETRRADDLLAPSLIVGPAGGFVGFGEPVELERVARKLEERGERDLAGILRVAQRDPAASLRARDRARELWETWFGAWLGVELTPGDPVDFERLAYVGLGSAILPARVRVECLGRTELDGERCARLSLRVAHVGGDFPAIAAAALDLVPAEARAGGALRARQVDLVGTFAIATGRPMRVQARTTRVYSDGEGGTRSEKDVRAFVFDWAGAKVQAERAPGGGDDAADD